MNVLVIIISRFTHTQRNNNQGKKGLPDEYLFFKESFDMQRAMLRTGSKEKCTNSRKKKNLFINKHKFHVS